MPRQFEGDQHGTRDIASKYIHVENENARFAVPYFLSANTVEFITHECSTI